MAVGSFFALFDDIAALLDDVATMTKVAAQKTAGVLGDDLALNAEQVTGVRAERELPVVWAVAKGSYLNKVILVPVALLLSYTLPWIIIPLLMMGGAFLCFEGFEKISHYFLHNDKEEKHKHIEAAKDSKIDLVTFEKKKIKGAIRTDFILSAEIIVITLGIVANKPFLQQAGVLAIIAMVMTTVVYGLVAGIVKLDDVGIYLMQKKGTDILKQLQRKTGAKLLAFAPILMRTLSVVGTAAMFLVGGSIIGHNTPALHHFSEHLTQLTANISNIGGVLSIISPILINGVIGLTVGAICVGLFTVGMKLLGKKH